jgi:hypothetical protein
MGPYRAPATSSYKAPAFCGGFSLLGREARYEPATACGVEERVGLVELQLAGEVVPGFTASTHTMASKSSSSGESAVHRGGDSLCTRRDAESADHLHIPKIS